MTEQELKEKRALYLLDTMLHYTSENRGISLQGCLYSPVKNAQTISDGCAIGRKLPLELSAKLDAKTGGKSVGCNSVFEELPEEIKVLGKDFLSMVQGLHDNYEFWGFRGISPNGLSMARRIGKEFNLIF